MSSAADRTTLAAAANAVLGDNRISPYYRQSTTVGYGWVSLAARRRDDNGFDDFLNTWEIRVVLSQKVAEAEKWIDEHADTLVAGLVDHLVVTALTPAVLNIDSKTTVNALIIEGVREHI